MTLTGKNEIQSAYQQFVEKTHIQKDSKFLGIGVSNFPHNFVVPAPILACEFGLKMFAVIYSFCWCKVITDYANYDIIRGQNVTRKSMKQKCANFELRQLLKHLSL